MWLVPGQLPPHGLAIGPKGQDETSSRWKAVSTGDFNYTARPILCFTFVVGQLVLPIVLLIETLPMPLSPWDQLLLPQLLLLLLLLFWSSPTRDDGRQGIGKHGPNHLLLSVWMPSIVGITIIIDRT